MKKWVSLVLAAALSGILFVSVSHAASALQVTGPSPIHTGALQVAVNNKIVELPSGASVIIYEGTTLVPLNVVRSLGHDVSWDNSNKTASLTTPKGSITLRLGATSATLNGKQVKLSQPVMLRNNYVMVPLRFIAESSGASVGYSSSNQVVYVASATEQELANLALPSLATARATALSLPLVDMLIELEKDPTGNRSLVFFQEGRSDRFISIQNDVMSYYQVINGVKYKKGTAQVRAGQSGAAPFATIPYSLTSSYIGAERPEMSGRMVYFRALPGGGLEYGYATASGMAKVGETTTMELAIPGEQRVN